MTNQVVNPAEKVATKEKGKVFNFSQEELNFLKARQGLINELNLEIGDMVFVSQQYIFTKVFPRLGLDMEKDTAEYDLNSGTLTVTPKVIVPTPQVIVPK